LADGQAAQQWDGPTGDHNNVVYLVRGAEARATAALAEQNQPTYAKTTTRGRRTSVPGNPATGQAITVGGAAGRPP
jgi:hypothetical protein